MNKIKSVWIKADTGSWEENKSRVTTGLESGANAILLNDEDISKVRELGNIKIAAPSEDADIVVVGKESEGDGAIKLPSDFANSEDIAEAQHLTREGKSVAGYVVIKNKKY